MRDRSRKDREFYDFNGIIDQKHYEQNPEAQLFHKERLQQIKEVIRKYPEECKYFHYLRLYLIEGYSFREIGKMENTPFETIRNRLIQTIIFLKREITHNNLKFT